MTDTITLPAGHVAALVVVALVVGGVGALAATGPVQLGHQGEAAPEPGSNGTTPAAETPAVETFDSAAAFRAYLQSAERQPSARTARRPPEPQPDVERDAGDAPGATPTPQATGTPVETAAGDGGAAGDDGAAGDAVGEGGGAPRASDTNVQVAGVDEPAILKTTPDTLYYASPSPRRAGGHGHEDREGETGTHLINASDPAAPEVAGRVNASGRLLLAGETLVVIEGDRLVGYDVTDRADPELAWERNVSDRVVTARLYDGSLYLVTADRVDRREPCPVEPMEGVSVPCTEVHHPADPVPVDTTYTVSVLDPGAGSVADSTSFVGAGGASAVYVSGESVYVTYPEPVDRAALMAEFLLTNQSDRLDDATLERVEEIQSYDLTPRARRVELEAAIESWLAGLDPEERREAREALREDTRAWAAEHKREFERTGVVRFDVTTGPAPGVEAAATGAVPGRPLNQFALDEHEGNLRIATTVGGAMGTDSENDVYVLDGDLSTVGSVQGMGVTERVFAVRFVGDEAYVVTFRRVDPFHVVDLSDPTDPEEVGELELPGFSTYLHPLSEDRILGVGEEDGKVKLVVFDISDRSNPTVETDRILDERWSAAVENHRAFLIDRRHGVFFLPAGDQAYVFDYEDGLSEVTAVDAGGRARRTAFVGDNLYVFGDDAVTVVDQTTWEETATLSLSDGEEADEG